MLQIWCWKRRGARSGRRKELSFKNYIISYLYAIIIFPQRHYYQPLFTLVGGGMKKLENSYKPMKKVLPSNAEWKRDRAVKIDPTNNKVETANGDTIEYDYMVVAMGIELNYNKIPGAIEALNNPNTQVCSNYSPQYVSDVYKKFQNFKGGNAIFTFPASPVKCPGRELFVWFV